MHHLSLLCIPDPHVTEHPDHSDQLVQMEHLSKSKQLAEHGDSDTVIRAAHLLRSTQDFSSAPDPSQVSSSHCLSLVCTPDPQELEHDVHSDQLCH